MAIESKEGFVSVSLPELTVYVNESILYNLEAPSEVWVKSKLIGLSCVPGNVPVFTLLVSDAYVFSDIPPHFIRLHAQSVEDPLDLQDLVYCNCPSGTYAIQSFDSLKARKAHVWFKNAHRVVSGDYWFTVDFFEDNGLFHVLKLDNGQIACMPSHKIQFGKAPVDHSGAIQLVFPPYLKLRKTFKV